MKRVYTAWELCLLTTYELTAVRRKFRAEASRLGVSLELFDMRSDEWFALTSLVPIMLFQDTLIRARVRRSAARATIRSMQRLLKDWE